MSRIIYFKNIDDDNLSSKFAAIKENNSVFYSFLTNSMRTNELLGIREDVFDEICSHISEFSKNQSEISLVVSLALNLKCSPDVLLWSNSFIKQQKYDIDDFGIMINSALENDMPLDVINDLFNQGLGETELLTRIDEFVSVELPDDSTVSVDGDNKRVDNTAEGDMTIDNTFITHQVSPGPGNSKELLNSESQNVAGEVEYGDMFENLITVMSVSSHSNGEIKEIDDIIKQVIAKYQVATAELTANSADIIHILEQKEEEVKRLNALIQIQQQLMSKWQLKISELRSENARLNTKILAAEKSEMKREAINQKIAELKNLTFETQMQSSDDVYSFE